MYNLHEMLKKHYSMNPNKILYRFHNSNAELLKDITYNDFYEKAKIIANNLLSNKYNCKKNDRIIICFPPGIEYIISFFGCIIAGVIPVPVYPPNPNKFKDDIISLNNIIKDCDAKYIIVDNNLNKYYSLKKIQYYYSSPNIKWIKYSKFSKMVNNITLPTIQKNDIAFIQYTSGSTGSPKGVVLSHNNIISNDLNIFSCQDYSELYDKFNSLVFISWLPPYHDMGLIGHLIYPIIHNGECNFCSPGDFIKSPKVWLKLISMYNGNVTASPNFGFDLCIRKINDCNDYNLSSLKILMNAAEKILPDTLNNFYKNFEACGLKREMLCPSYGIAENTIAVSMYGNKTLYISKNDLKNNIVTINSEKCIKNIELQSIGRKCHKTFIKIVDPETKTEITNSQLGEIWVNSDSKAIKYWNKPELTEEILNAKIKNDNESYLRTGDIGFEYENEIYFVSRIKNVINIRGKKYYPEDICSCLKNIKELKPGCQSCFSISKNDEENIVLISEIRNNINNYNDVITSILSTITKSYSLSLSEIILIKEKDISKTTSGKIQHFKNKNRYLNNEFKKVHSWKNKSTIIEKEDIDDTNLTYDIYEKKIHDILFSKFNINKSDIKNNIVLSEFGIDSMQFIQLSQFIENILGIDTDCIMIENISLGKLLKLSWNEFTNLKNNSKWEKCLPKHYYDMLKIEKKFQESIPNLDFDQETHILKYNRVHEDCVHFSTQKGDFITCASNAYTSLSRHPRIREAVKNAVDTYGTGIFGPRVVVGASKLLWELEAEISDFLSTESAVIFSTAYLAMITVLSCLTKNGINYIFYDDLSHMCILDALNGLGNNVKIIKFKHNDYKDLENKVNNNVKPTDRGSFKLVIADALFGMDGDFFDLPNFHPICKKYGLTLLLDEAHSMGSTGKTGRGIEEHFQMYNTVDIKLGGMNKGMPLLGGWVCSSKEICKLLRFRCHGTMFTGTMPPPMLACALEAIRVLKDEPIHVERLEFNKKYLINGLKSKGFKLSNKAGVSPIIVIIIPNDTQLLSMYHITQQNNLQIFISIFPAVPKNEGRIRISTVAGYTQENMDKIINTLHLAGVKSGFLQQ